MKKLLLFQLCLYFCSGIYAQKKIKGSYDRITKKFAPEGNYQVGEFREGLAAFHQGLEYGIVDTLGNIIAEPKYHQVEGFSDGLSMVSVWNDGDEKYGFINSKGKEVIPAVYDAVDSWFYRSTRFNDLLVIENDQHYALFKRNGEQVTEFLYQGIGVWNQGLAMVSKDGKQGFIDKDGKVVIPLVYNHVDQMTTTPVRVNKDGKWGFIDSKGKIVIPIIYEDATGFGVTAKVKKDGKWGIIDNDGKEVLAAAYESLGYYKDGVAVARQNGKYGYIDMAGNVIIPFEYDHAGSFNLGRAYVSKNKKWGHINKKNEITTPLIYEQTNDFAPQGYAGVKLNGLSGRVDTTGKVILPIRYVGIDHYYDGMLKVMRMEGDTKKFGFADSTGKEVIPCIYDRADRFSEDRAAVAVGDKWGYVDKEGKVVIPIIYISASRFVDGKANVVSANKQMTIDKNGIEIPKR
ncbi:MAG: repeat-containing protein [Bacteroidota bacterium]|jgi:hypothetical protein|nr:repeat-containing protein [Bacteroidota bacterium]